MDILIGLGSVSLLVILIFVFGIGSQSFLTANLDFQKNLSSNGLLATAKSNQQFGDTTIQPKGFTECSQLRIRGNPDFDRLFKLENNPTITQDSLSIQTSSFVCLLGDVIGLKNIHTIVHSDNLDINPSSLESLSFDYNYNVKLDGRPFNKEIRNPPRVSIFLSSDSRNIELLERKLSNEITSKTSQVNGEGNIQITRPISGTGVNLIINGESQLLNLPVEEYELALEVNGNPGGLEKGGELIKDISLNNINLKMEKIAEDTSDESDNGEMTEEEQPAEETPSETQPSIEEPSNNKLLIGLAIGSGILFLVFIIVLIRRFR